MVAFVVCVDEVGSLARVCLEKKRGGSMKDLKTQIIEVNITRTSIARIKPLSEMVFPFDLIWTHVSRRCCAGKRLIGVELCSKCTCLQKCASMPIRRTTSPQYATEGLTEVQVN